MSLWSRLFGPSKTDILLQALQESQGLVRSSHQAIIAATEQQREWWAALRPTGEPNTVQLRTPAELASTAERLGHTTRSGQPLRRLDPAVVLADLQSTFAEMSQHDTH